MAGSEGSLAVVTEARLKLTPFQKQRALFVLRYPSFDDALASSEWLVATDPGSVETIDETVMKLAKADVIYDQVKPFLLDEPGDRDARHQPGRVQRRRGQPPCSARWTSCSS